MRELRKVHALNSFEGEDRGDERVAAPVRLEGFCPRLTLEWGVDKDDYVQPWQGGSSAADPRIVLIHTLAGARVGTQNVIEVLCRRGKISVVGAAQGPGFGFVSEELSYVVNVS